MGQPLTDEQKAAMAEGRRRARARRKAAQAEQAEKLADWSVPRDEPPLVVAAAGLMPAQPPPGSDFEVFLATLDAETRDLVGESELRIIFEGQRARAREDRKIQLSKAANEKAQLHSRATAGLLSAEDIAASKLREWNNQKVTIRIDLPTFGDNSGIGSDGIRLDGQLFEHGKTYTVTRGKAMTLRDIMWHNQQAELTFLGLDRSSALRQIGIGALNGAI